jgi:hypothetical protein
MSDQRAEAARGAALVAAEMASARAFDQQREQAKADQKKAEALASAAAHRALVDGYATMTPL